MNEALPTLLFPFHRGILEMPRAEGKVLFFGPDARLRLPSQFTAELHLVQGFRPDFLALRNAGYHVTPEPEGDGYDASLLLLGRHRRENEAQLAEALQRVRPGGLILAAGTKKNGAPSFRKRVAELLQVGDHLSKHHGIVFWLRRPEVIDRTVIAGLCPPKAVTGEGYHTAVGGFSEGAADPGSQLLASSLPSDITGEVADFAAGWGYLSLRLAERSPVTSLDLYEAHHASLECARRNFAAHAPGRAIRFFWHDLLGEPIEHRYDTIVMNPPFHRNRATEPEMGREMVEAAVKSLKPGGRLFVVANRGLPYEAVIQSALAHGGEITRGDTYKVLWGRK